MATSPHAAYDSRRKERALQQKLDEKAAAEDGGDQDFDLKNDYNPVTVQNRTTIDPETSQDI